MFSKLTEFTRRFAHHRHAALWLFLYTVIESLFFPVPADVLLVPLALANPKKALFFALIAALSSTTGGMIGYSVGFYGFKLIARPILEWLCLYMSGACPAHFMPMLENAFDKYGIGVVAFSSLSPIIPYRFTILAAGLAKMPFPPFVIVSFMVHWLRYSIVSWLRRRWGQKHWC